MAFSFGSGTTTAAPAPSTGFSFSSNASATTTSAPTASTNATEIPNLTDVYPWLILGPEIHKLLDQNNDSEALQAAVISVTETEWILAVPAPAVSIPNPNNLTFKGSAVSLTPTQQSHISELVQKLPINALQAISLYAYAQQNGIEASKLFWEIHSWALPTVRRLLESKALQIPTDKWWAKLCGVIRQCHGKKDPHWEKSSSLAAECLFLLASASQTISLALLQEALQIQQQWQWPTMLHAEHVPSTLTNNHWKDPLQPLQWQAQWTTAPHKHTLEVGSLIVMSIVGALRKETTTQELDAIVASLNQVQHQGVRGLFLGVLSTLLPATDARRREFSESCCRWQCWTLVRLTLMPALVHNPSRDLLLQVLRDTLQEYSVPLNLTSKAKWLEDQELELAIRRDEAKTQAQFQAQMGMNAPPPVPDEVDLLTRQDCWDDLIALVVTLCYEGCVFFDLEEGGIVGVGPWMRELEVLQADDDDLRASYYQLLAGMALSSPSLIHQVLSDNSTSTKGKGPTWTSLLENLRWLVHELDGQGRGSTTTATSSTTNSAPSMQYYYQGTSSLEKQQKKSKTKRSGNGSNEDVLSSENWYFLDAILNCLHNTGLASPEARHTILSSKIAASSQGFDSALMILFKLSTLGIPSRVRGRVFNTIGALIQPDDETMYQKALEAWDMIDRIGIVPIALLERSGRGRGRTYGMDNINPKGGMGFPPRLPGPAAETWVADDPAYGILYEMEWLEAPHGVYPSTRGFLNLLTSLVRTAGSTGRSAYLEYVCHMVLPRLTGRIYGPKLPFEGPQEECRLAMAALEVVQTTLAMYPVPGLSFDQLRKVAGKSLLHPRVAELSVKKPVLSDVEHAKAHDGTAAHRSAGINGTTALASNSDSVATNLPMPSPGFLLMVQVLTSGELLQSLLSVLTKWTDAEECANLSKDLALARGLFGSTPPDYAVFYFADQRKVAVDLTELLVNLESMDYGVEPGSTSVWQMALSCLCAIVAREDVIIKIVKDNSLITGLVPQLQWKEGSSPTSFVGHEASLASCGRILWNTNFQHGVLSRLLQWIQSHEDWELTATALTVLLYMDSTVVGVSSAIPVESQALARFLLRRRPIVTDNETAKHVLLDYLLTKARGTTSDAISATTIMNDECLQALLALAKDLTNLDAELGTKCHELLHRTTSPRLELFWVNQLPALVSCCDSTAVVHSVAWCLKSIKQTRVQPEVLRHLLSVIPLDRWPKLSPTTDISPDLARKAKIAMKGPTEVTAGYFLIDPGKVGDDQEDWCVDWNTYVTRDCAAAHVSEALNTLAQNTQHNDHFLLDVLGSLTKSTVLDETHYTAATYNLAHVVLTLVSKAGIDILPDAHQCRNLLARSIVSSGFHTQVQPNAGRRNERTAILAGSLGLLLEGHVEPDENFVPAGRTLLQIVMNGDGHIAAWARSCLTQILCQEQNEEATDVKESMVGQVLHGLAEDLVLRLDNTNAVKLLQDITSMSWGPQTLEQAGILDKLLIFARQFSHESIPLEDHLLLLGGLVPSLASVVKVQEILEAYETSFTHLVQTFPQDGDCLEVFMLLLRSSAMPEEFARRTEATQFAVYLAENPLPQEFLMTLPPFLERDDVDARPSWWESIGLDSASGISNQVASFAVRGVKLASCGIASQEGSTETRGLCRALVQTTYCFRGLQGSMQLVEFSTLTNSLLVLVQHILAALCRQAEAYKQAHVLPLTFSPSLVRQTIDHARPHEMRLQGNDEGMAEVSNQVKRLLSNIT